jgi:SAM-dependent methyltransferase
MDDAHNTDQIAYWNEAVGATWVECQDALDTQLEPIGRRVIEALALSPGQAVLDVGCGCGETTLSLGERVGDGGHAVGADISRPMLAVAQQRARGQPQVSFRVADAQTFAFEPAAFDAIHSRFGVMFFDDPTAAFVNLRRALKPGGRLGFVCWRGPGENPIMSLPMAAASPFLPPPEPPEPGAPGPFAFADPERVRTILADAGFSEIAVAPQDMPAGGNSLEVALELALKVGPLGRMLREHPDAGPKVLGAIRAAFQAHTRPDGRVFLDSATWLVSARNP